MTNAFARYTQQVRTDRPAFRLAEAARVVASRYPLMAAMKQFEVHRSDDDSWRRMAPPLTPPATVNRPD